MNPYLPPLLLSLICCLAAYVLYHRNKERQDNDKNKVL